MQQRQVSSMRWSGIDVSKHSFDAGWVGPKDSAENFQRILRTSFPMCREGVASYIQWLQKKTQGESRPGESLSVRVVMEATGPASSHH